MLVSRRGDMLQLVTHPDHAALAGTLAERWGNARFASVDQRAPLTVAAARHDDGWRELDGIPAYAADAQRPAHFLEVSLPETIDPYRRGLDALYEDDRTAGLLTSMHWAGLYSARWGVQGGPFVGHPLAQEIVIEQEDRWIRAAREQWDGTGLRSVFEAQLWHAYEILQAVDLLSLALCTVDLDAPVRPADPAVSVPDTLREVDQAPGARLVPNVPLGAGRHCEVELRVVEPRVVTVDPSPFDDDVTVRLRARSIADVGYDDAASSAAAFHAAEVRDIACTLVAA